MDSPREVKVAIFLSWIVVASETADRLWRISKDPDASTFSRLGFNLMIATLSSAVLIASFIFFAARRHNWARIALLITTLGGWCLWFVWLSWFRARTKYVWWEWLSYGSLTVLELAAIILLFRGKGALWYQTAERK